MTKITRHFESQWMFKYDDGVDVFLVTCHSPKLTMLHHEDFTQMYEFSSSSETVTLEQLAVYCKSPEAIAKSSQVMKDSFYDKEDLLKMFDKTAASKKISNESLDILKSFFTLFDLAETARNQLILHGMEFLIPSIKEIVDPNFTKSQELMMKFVDAIPEFLQEEKTKGAATCTQNTLTEDA